MTFVEFDLIGPGAKSPGLFEPIVYQCDNEIVINFTEYDVLHNSFKTLLAACTATMARQHFLGGVP